MLKSLALLKSMSSIGAGGGRAVRGWLRAAEAQPGGKELTPTGTIMRAQSDV